MSGRNLARRLIVAALSLAALVVAGCASGGAGHPPSARDWTRAAEALKTDTSLMRNEKILFNAAMLYSLPNRGSYDPTLATRLFERLLKEFPGTSRRQIAVDQLSMLYELQRVRNEGLADRQSMQMRIAALERDTLALHHALDSVATALHSAEDQNTALRKNASRTERDLQDRESQLTALRAELKRLKEIDLHPPMRNAPHAHPRDTSGATAGQQPR